MRTSVMIVGGALIVGGSFMATLWIADMVSPLCPKGETTLLSGPFSRTSETSFAYVTPLIQKLDAIADDVEKPNRSPVALCEDSNLLGPSHFVHSGIAKQGGGAYSHWKGLGFIFSSSDNTDPNTNGRIYRAVRPTS